MIEDYLKRLEDPKAPISYPQKPVYTSSNGDVVWGLGTGLPTDGSIVPPLQVVRRPGLGDKIFALSATFAYLQANPEVDVAFSGFDNDTHWLSQVIDWCHIGINENANTVANLDNTPCNGGDRTKLMGQILGVDVVSMAFPIKTPKRRWGLSRPYYVFAPWAAGHGPRSLPAETVIEVLKDSPIPLALVDAIAGEYDVGPMVTNCTGIDQLGLISLIQDSAGVVAVDTGVPWLGAAMGKPCLIFFSHIDPAERTQTCQNVLSVRPSARCAPCGDHIGTMPACRFRDSIPACQSDYTPAFTSHWIREFDSLCS